MNTLVSTTRTSILLALLSFTTTISIGQETFIGAGNTTGITVTTSSNHLGYDGANTINGTGLDAPLMDASRFLAQATMGSDMAEINRVKDMGMERWLDEQLGIAPNLLTPQMEEIWETTYQWNYDYYIAEHQEQNPGAPITQEVLDRIDEAIFGPSAVQFHYTWYQNTMASSDQLRQRMAYALSQILVISIDSDLGDEAESLTAYYDILLRNAFGNYKDILREVTLSPSMGLYLSHYNNPKEVPSENLHPDENFAREIMQLFSIGLYQLNQDGTRTKDIDGNDIPTYNNNNIKELAKVFTGLGAAGIMENPWVDQPFFGMDWYLADKVTPLRMYPTWHETSAKTILDDLILPANQDGMTDIDMTIDYLFNHPNVAPFISRQLIQRMVKSNPSPGYISRVSAAFNNNGNGVRGDLGAVVKAILLDEEARTCEELEHPDNGRLIEPILRITNLARSFPLTCFQDTTEYFIDGESYDKTTCKDLRYWWAGFDIKIGFRQSPLGAPSVFNFYLPNHQPVGVMAQEGLVAPEFKIHDSSTSITYINFLWRTLLWDYFGGSWESDVNPDVGWLAMDTEEITDLASHTEALINYLDILYTRGQLTDRKRQVMRDFLDEQPQWVSDWYKVRGVMYLILLSPDYTIAK